jgi:hypothetical protein
LSAARYSRASSRSRASAAQGNEQMISLKRRREIAQEATEFLEAFRRGLPLPKVRAQSFC